MSEGVWIAIIGIVGLFVTGLFALKSLKATLKNNLDIAILQLQNQQKQTHDLVNSRMSELLELTRKSSELKGNIEGRDALKEEQKKEVQVEVKTTLPPTVTNIKNVEIAHVENVENVETLITKTKEEEERKKKEEEEEQKK